MFHLGRSIVSSLILCTLVSVGLYVNHNVLQREASLMMIEGWIDIQL